jgi:hypothetical protein
VNILAGLKMRRGRQIICLFLAACFGIKSAHARNCGFC